MWTSMTLLRSPLRSRPSIAPWVLPLGPRAHLVSPRQAQFGARWPALCAALARQTQHVALLNPFLAPPQPGAASDALPGAQGLPPRLALGPAAGPVQALQYLPPEHSNSYPPPIRDPASGLLPWYWLDWASLLPPLALGVTPGQAVLDMCAAPGGKSLVLAQLLFAASPSAAENPSSSSSSSIASSSSSSDAGNRDNPSSSSGSSGRLVCNELDAGRRRRLLGVLREYLPEDVRQLVRVTPHNGAAFWRAQEPETYDRILLDAPCSSDRHIVQQAAARARGTRGSGGLGGGGGEESDTSMLDVEILKADWSVKRCRAIAGEQAKLLAAAVRALKPGGRLVYSTCSIAEVENDEVVDKVLRKAGGTLAVAAHTLGAASSGSSSGGGSSSSSNSSSSEAGPGAAGRQAAAAQVAAADFEQWGAERTRHGWLLLPDATGWGPMYVAVLDKLESSDLRRVKVNKYAHGGGSGGDGSGGSGGGA